MNWVTREKARVDRIACPWLISRFIDRDAKFLFVPDAEVMRVAAREKAPPFDGPGVELGRHGDRCSFAAFLAKDRLADPGRCPPARPMRAARTRSRPPTAGAPGLYALRPGS